MLVVWQCTSVGSIIDAPVCGHILLESSAMFADWFCPYLIAVMSDTRLCCPPDIHRAFIFPDIFLHIDFTRSDFHQALTSFIHL